tara:strand:+ start:61 stop:582 length:522 start_codon:yes stop_codon:yes gene_type:complete
MIIKSVRGFNPIYGDDCFFAENSVLIGDVIMGNNCSIWYSAVVRGDVNSIKIGDRVNIQDGVVIHGTYLKAKTEIGNDVSIGHNAIVHGCKIENSVLIGMGSIVMDNSIIESNSIVAAGSVVLENTHIKAGSIFAGIPAKKIKNISEELKNNEIDRIASSYIKYSNWYKDFTK